MLWQLMQEGVLISVAFLTHRSVTGNA